MALRYIEMDQKQQTMLAVEIAENKYKKDDKIYYEDQQKNIEKLINSLYGYIKLKAYKYSKKLKSGTIELNVQQELEQEAIVAIYKALEKYDYKKCPVFFPYAKQWIDAYMRTHQTKNKSLCKVETRASRKFLSKIYSISDKSIDEQIKILGISKSEYENVVAALRPSKQLQKKASADDSEETEEYLRNDTLNPEEALLSKELTEKIQKITTEFKKELDKKEIDIFEQLIIGNASSAVLVEKHGITRQRIQQIKENILDRLKRRIKNNGINQEGINLIKSGYDVGEYL